MTKSLGVKSIRQTDNYHFAIEWSDGVVSVYRLSDLQKRCPCADCVDEYTGKRRLDESLIDPCVRAKRVVSVGRYALRVEFTKGCRAGIFDFDMLREMGS